MATHSSVLAWRTPGTAGPGGLPSMGSHRHTRGCHHNPPEVRGQPVGGGAGLGLGCLGPVPVSTAYSLSDLGKLMNPAVTQFPNL